VDRHWSTASWSLEGGWCIEFSRIAGGTFRGKDGTLVYYLFDLLHLDGWDLRPCG